MNKINYVFLLVSILLCNKISAQVGIGNTSPNSLLDITASNVAAPSSNDGFLVPRVDNFPSTNPSSSQNSMMLYLNNNLTGVNISGTAANYSSGFYYWDNSLTDWIKMTQKPAWHVEGNENVTSGTHFLGTTNAEEVDFRVNNKLVGRLTELGQFELESDSRSLFIGFEAGENYDATLGEQNVFVGYQAGKGTTEGRDNVGVGAESMKNNTIENFNVGIGDGTLRDNTTGNNNTSVGNDALQLNQTGNSNTAVGQGALLRNVSGSANVGIGTFALLDNVLTSRNIAIGNNSLQKILSGNNNTALGYKANQTTTSVANTVSLGSECRARQDGGIAVGFKADSDGLSAIAIGNNANSTGSNSVAIGNGAVSTSNQIVLGNGSITEVKTSGIMKADSFLATGTGTTYADYVFEDYYTGISEIKSDYKFNTLENAESFVRKNGHLPGVKSYEEVMKNGFKLDLTEATITNLEKIEEQFLYITELKKQIDDQNTVNKEQAEKIKSLEERLQAIEKLLDN